MKPVAIILSGCGVYDGSEITEAAGLVIALSQAGLPYRFYAPDRDQMHVVDHAAGGEADESRHILSEAARIARGDIQPLAALEVADHSAVAFPGGFGAAKNLCNFASAGEQARLYDDVAAITRAALAARKPMLALCAAPLVLALAAHDAGLQATLTFGNPEEGAALAKAARAWGQHAVHAAVDEACVDAANLLVTVPAYMYGAASPAQVFAGCQAGVAALQRLLAD
jgi:enhancing lycopene biosynthesis protein 2